jgi:hypothetical protein
METRINWKKELSGHNVRIRLLIKCRGVVDNPGKAYIIFLEELNEYGKEIR